MLERYGIVTRETVLAEGVPGGFSSLYGELSNLEMLGTARRGYFVEGLGGAQFALAGAVERLRSLPRCRGRVPAARRHRPGAALRRRAALAEARGGPAPGPHPGRLRAAARRQPDPLRRARRPGHRPPGRARGRGAGRGDRTARRGGRAQVIPKLAIERVDGEPVIGSGLEEALIAAGFSRQPRGGRWPELKLGVDARGRHDPPRRPPDERGARAAGGSSSPTRRIRARRSTAAPPSSSGATLEAAEARGKHLLAHFSDDLVLHSHLGMNGRWFVTADGRASRTASRGCCWPRAGRSPRRTAARSCGCRASRGSATTRACASSARTHCGPGSIARRRPRACGGSAPAARSATRCSTSGSSPGSAT